MPIPRLRLTRFNTSKDLNLLMWELTSAPASERRRLWAMVEQLNGVAEDYLRECGDLEELAFGYGIGARQLRRWMWAYMEGGIAGLLQRRYGRRGRKRKISRAQFIDQVLSTIEQQMGKPDRELTAKEAYQWARKHLQIPVSYATFMRYLGRRSHRFTKRRARTTIGDGLLAGPELGLAWLREIVHGINAESDQQDTY
jgi:transposase